MDYCSFCYFVVRPAFLLISLIFAFMSSSLPYVLLRSIVAFYTWLAVKFQDHFTLHRNPFISKTSPLDE